MCWYSSEHAGQMLEAEAGERLGIRKMHWDSNWVVREAELETKKPRPVCMIDRTRVLFRISESQQESSHPEQEPEPVPVPEPAPAPEPAPTPERAARSLNIGPEAEAVFRMLKDPKRDVFEFPDGKQIDVDNLPPGLIFDVLLVPRSEQLSAVLSVQEQQEKEEPAVQDQEEMARKSVLVRLLGRF